MRILRKPALDPSSFLSLFELTHSRQATYRYSFDKQYEYGIMPYWISGNNPPIPMIRLEGSALVSPLFAAHARFELCAAKCGSATPFVYRSCALFHFPYPVSPLLATYTRTAGCISTLPILKLCDSFSQAPSPIFSGRNFLTPYLSYSSALFCTHKKLNSFLFMLFRTLLQKHRGVGDSSHSHIACWSHESLVRSSGFPSSHPLESPRYTQRACTQRNEARA